MPGANASPERAPLPCHCCGQWSVPERLDVRDDPAQLGRLRVVEVLPDGHLLAIVTHVRGLCCTRHARGVRDVLAGQRDRSRAVTYAALAQVYGWACGEE